MSPTKYNKVGVHAPLANCIAPVVCFKRGTPALHLNGPAGGSCSGAGLGLVWYWYCVFLKFVCSTPKKEICFGPLRGWGCEESKNKTSAKRKSTMNSLNPSIIQVDSFKCSAGVSLCKPAPEIYLLTKCSLEIKFLHASKAVTYFLKRNSLGYIYLLKYNSNKSHIVFFASHFHFEYFETRVSN